MRRNLHLAKIGNVGSVVMLSLALLNAGCVEQGEAPPQPARAPRRPRPNPRDRR